MSELVPIAGSFEEWLHSPGATDLAFRQRCAIEIARLRAELADESPGTPLGRLNVIGKAAEDRGLCRGIEAAPAEVFLIEAYDRLRAELATERTQRDNFGQALAEAERRASYDYVQSGMESLETQLAAARQDAEEIARLKLRLGKYEPV